MRQILATLCTLAALTLLPHYAQAGIEWSYVGDPEVQVTSGNSTLTFMATKGSAGNSSGVVMYNIKASSTAANNAPDHFDKTPFTITFSVIDELARTSVADVKNELGTLTFKGFFTGDMSKGSLNNWAVSWETNAGSLVLGNDLVGTRQYDVTIDPTSGFIPPSPNSPTANGFGVVYGSVVARELTGEPNPDPDPTPDPDPNPDPSPDPTETPEPSSLLLAGMALSGAGVARWRRRRTSETK